jgi:hypothetical protein
MPYGADVIEVQALGHHLGAHQDIHRPLSECGEDPLQGILPRVVSWSIRAMVRCWEEFPQFLFDLLCAESQHAQPWNFHNSRNGWAVGSADRSNGTAVGGEFVVGQAYIALVALRYPAARFALPNGHIASAVLEDDHLLTTVQRNWMLSMNVR